MIGFGQTATEYFYKANDYSENGQYQLAIDNYTKCIELKPDYAYAYNNRGLSYHSLKNYEDAIADYTRALRIDPDYYSAYYNRGRSYLELGNNEECIADNIRAIRINPDHSDSYRNRGIAKENLKLSYCSDYKKACDLGDEECCEWYNEQCQGSNSSSLSAKDYFDKAYNNESDWRYKIDNYTKCLRIEPDYGDSDGAIAYYNRGFSYANLENYKAAIYDYSRAIGIDPDYADAYYNRGNAYANLENYEDAIADYTRAIRIKPDNSNSYRNRGIARENSKLSYCSDYKKACDLGDEECCEWYYKQCR